MAEQLHKRLSLEQVLAILRSYAAGEMTSQAAADNLAVKHSQFFKLAKRYEDEGASFTIAPKTRSNQHRRVPEDTENQILEELKKEKKLIDNKSMPVHFYNYSAVRDDLLKQHNIKVSVPTIIARAKQNGFYLPKREKKIHAREVITNFTGELIQHDSSLHQWSPFVDDKWYLITSIDDFSRGLLFADLFERESSWAHICSIESVILKYGCPLKYYPDQHSIFRFVRERDKFTPWYTAHKSTDEVDPQFKQVLKDCGTEVIYALSPQAKGKIERPYRWLQDRMVRACAKNHIMDIKGAKKILKELVYDYNNKWVHSTTKEIPMVRLEAAINAGRSLFRPFTIQPPFKSAKDIFCLRDQRVVNPYRKITFKQAELLVPKSLPRETVDLKIIPNVQKDLAEVRIWNQKELVSVQLVKHGDLGLVHF